MSLPELQDPTQSIQDLPAVWPLKGPYDHQRFKDYLRTLNDRTRPSLSLIQAELARCARRPDYFVMTYCYTKDEHDALHSVKRFPRYKYIPFLVRQLARHNRLLVYKSRQVLVTWSVLAYLLYKACWFPHRLIFVQSKKEEDAAALIDRMKHMYEHLPWWIQAAAPLKRPLLKQPFNKLTIANGSLAWGVPQGADILRQYTASVIFQDEMAFQDKAEEAYNASRPTVEGGGQYIGVSSANGKGFFYRMVYDKLNTPTQGL